MKKYNNLSKEDLIKLIEKQDQELKAKKYGLVWDSEKEPEKVVLDCENNLPILKRISEKEIRTDESDDNILIEGDNYHALTVLNYTHKGKIDVIYIDPPYNTGNKDFIYNDKYVDLEDGYRHSKWLNFMEKRLNLAYNLLKDTGVIFISIDDNEQAQLKLLCDKIFNENNFITNIIWQSKTGASDAKTIDTLTEYVLVYAKSKNQAQFSRNKNSYEEKRYRFKDKYEKERGSYYPDNLDRGGLRYSDSLNFPIKCPDGKITYPNGRTKFVNDGWTWKWGENKVKWGIENGYIEFKKTIKKQSGWAVYYKNYMYADNEGNLIERSAPQKNVINDIKTGDGATIIKQLFGHQVFKYSKPVQMIKKVIDYISLEKNPTILDFMAGSGTTGHAILELNKEDGGKRKFILCTNNELNGLGSELAEQQPEENKEKFGICQRVCYPRLEKAIKGYEKNGEGEFKEGLGGNLQYFKTDLIPVEKIDKIGDRQRHELTEKAGQMIAIKENTFEELELNEWYQIFASKDNSRKTAIYFRENADKFEELVNKIKNTKTILYIFSYGVLDKKLFKYLGKNIIVEDIPEPIIDIYKEINQTLKDK